MGRLCDRGMARNQGRWNVIGHLVRKLGGSAAGFALCAAGVMMVAAPQPAYASDWGCEVVLCLATPGSPTTYPACVQPITELWKTLAMGGSFPTCTGVGITTKKEKHGYTLSVTRPDGVTSRYALDTRYETVTPR